MTASPLITDLFDAQVARVPQRTALRDRHGSLSYAETARRAELLAARLRAACPRPGARIGLHLARTSEVVVAMIAVLRAGHTYVPLDPGYPPERLRFTAADAELSLLLSDQPVPELLAELPLLRTDLPDTPPTLAAPAHPARPVDPGSPAYVIYTSGSTGTPKGVQVPHRNVVALVRACARRYQLLDGDVWTMFHSPCFDFSVWEIWGALLHGATLVVVDREVAASPRRTLDLLVREQVTVLNVVPSVFRHLVRAAARLEQPPALRYVIFGGESIDVRDVRAWRARFGSGTRFVNTYGITEATVFVTYRPLTDHELDREPDPVRDAAFALDIGEALDGWQVEVLDEDGKPVQPGEVGEIHVAGAGVALGYLNRPELTAERFVEATTADSNTGAGTSTSTSTRIRYRSGDLARLTADGVYCYAGRADDQVKINGFRIELGEVESVLLGAPGVGELVVVRTVSRVGEPMMTVFFTTDAPQATRPDPADALAGFARERLPVHMVPGRFVRLPELPVNPSGKTDRKALAALPATPAPSR